VVGTLVVKLLDSKTAFAHEENRSAYPDGTMIVCAAGQSADRADHLFLRSLNGKVIRQLTSDDANDATPRFSDGSLRCRGSCF
jgi:hypothetical protein